MSFTQNLLESCAKSFVEATHGLGRYPHKPGVTYCNFAVQDAARATIGDVFLNMRANDIYQILKAGHLRITDADAAATAAANTLVVAAQFNPDGPGHVAVVLPMTPVFSAKWKKMVPIVFNVGKTIFLGKGANWAFGDEPEYFAVGRVNG